MCINFNAQDQTLTRSGLELLLSKSRYPHPVFGSVLFEVYSWFKTCFEIVAFTRLTAMTKETFSE